MGGLHSGYLAGVGWCHLVWVNGVGSKARSSPGPDGVLCVAGSLQICFTRILVSIHRSDQKVLSICQLSIFVKTMPYEHNVN